MKLLNQYITALEKFPDKRNLNMMRWFRKRTWWQTNKEMKKRIEKVTWYSYNNFVWWLSECPLCTYKTDSHENLIRRHLWLPIEKEDETKTLIAPMWYKNCKYSFDFLGDASINFNHILYSGMPYIKKDHIQINLTIWPQEIEKVKLMTEQYSCTKQTAIKMAIKQFDISLTQ